jgi:hypothetical protein
MRTQRLSILLWFLLLVGTEKAYPQVEQKAEETGSGFWVANPAFGPETTVDLLAPVQGHREWDVGVRDLQGGYEPVAAQMSGGQKLLVGILVGGAGGALIVASRCPEGCEPLYLLSGFLFGALVGAGIASAF